MPNEAVQLSLFDKPLMQGYQFDLDDKGLKPNTSHKVTSPDGKTYTCTISPQGKASCDCTGYKYRRACKHVAQITDLMQSGVGEQPGKQRSKLKEPEVRRPLSEVQPILDRVLKVIEPLVKKVTVAGSIRRGRKDVKDADIVCIGTATPVANALAKEGLSFVVSGPSILRGHAEGFLMDIRFTDEEHYGALLLMYTGPKEFNIRMRSDAKSKGMSLNEYGLSKDGKLLASRTEKDIFDALGWTYTLPKDRK